MWLHSYSPTAEVNHTNYLKISVKKLNSRIGVVENLISFMEDKAKKFPQNIVWKDYIYKLWNLEGRMSSSIWGTKTPKACKAFRNPRKACIRRV